MQKYFRSQHTGCLSCIGGVHVFLDHTFEFSTFPEYSITLFGFQKKSFLKFGSIFQRHAHVAATNTGMQAAQGTTAHFTCLPSPQFWLYSLCLRTVKHKTTTKLFLLKKSFLCFFFFGGGGLDGVSLCIQNQKNKTRQKQKTKTKGKSSVFSPRYTENV